MSLLKVICMISSIFCFETEVLAKVRGVPGVDYPNYSSIPNTSFKCSEQFHIPGFYADIETKCQVFHHCYENRKESFLCPEGTAFNEAIQSCDYWYSFDCDPSQKSNRPIKSKYKDAPFLPVKIHNTSHVFEKMAALYDPNEIANLSFLHDNSSVSQNEGNLDVFDRQDGQYFEDFTNIHNENNITDIQFHVIRIDQPKSNILDSVTYESIAKDDVSSLNEAYISNGDKNIVVSNESKKEKQTFDETHSFKNEPFSEMLHQLDTDYRKSETKDIEGMLSDVLLSDIIEPHEILVKRLSEREISRKKLRRQPKYVVLQAHESELQPSNKKYKIEEETLSVKMDAKIDSPSKIFSYNENERIVPYEREENIAIPTSNRPKRKRKPIDLTKVVEKSTETDISSPLMTGNAVDSFFFSSADQTNSESTADVNDARILSPEKTVNEKTGINDKVENAANLNNESNEIFESLRENEIHTNPNDSMNIKQFDSIHESGNTEHYSILALKENSKNVANEKTEFDPREIKTGRYLEDILEREKPHNEELLTASSDDMRLTVSNEINKFNELNESGEDGFNFESDTFDTEYQSTETNMVRNEIFIEENDEQISQTLDNLNSNIELGNSLPVMDIAEYLDDENKDTFQDTGHYDTQLINGQSTEFLGSLQDVGEINMDSDSVENVQDMDENAMNDYQLDYLSYQTLEDNFDEDTGNTDGQFYENIDSNVMSADGYSDDTTDYSPSMKDMPITEEPFVSDELGTTLFDLLEDSSEALKEDNENQEHFMETSSKIYDFTTYIENVELQDIPEEVNDINVFDSNLNELEYENEVGNIVVAEESSTSLASQIFEQSNENIPIKQNIGVKIPESHYEHSELEKSIDSTFHTYSMPLPTNTYETNLYLQNVRQHQKTSANSISHPSFYKELEAGTVSNEDLPDTLKAMFEASQAASTRKKLPSKKDDASSSRKIALNDKNSIKKADNSKFSTSPFFDNRRSTSRLNEMLPLYLSEMKSNEVLSSRIGKMSKPAKFKKLIGFGKKLLAMKRAKLNMLKKFLKRLTQENF